MYPLSVEMANAMLAAIRNNATWEDEDHHSAVMTAQSI
jgi:hypothetical protein